MRLFILYGNVSRIFGLFSILLLIIFPLFVDALLHDGMDSYPQYQQTRQQFEQWENQIGKLNDTQLAGLADQITDYPLYPYLELEWLSANFSENPVSRIDRFLAAYSGTPLADSLRHRWLVYLWHTGAYQRFIDYSENLSSVVLRCRRLHSQLKLGTPVNALFDEIQALYLVGFSQDAACDPVFRQAFRGLNDDQKLSLIIQRLPLVLEQNNKNLARYLIRKARRQIKSSNLEQGRELWKLLDCWPHVINLTKRFLTTVSAKSCRLELVKTNSLLISEEFELRQFEWLSSYLKALVWREPGEANVLFSWATNELFLRAWPPEIVDYLAIAMSIEQHPSAEAFFAKATEGYLSQATLRWYVAQLAKKNDWARIILLSETLMPDRLNSPMFRYWLARAFQQTGQQRAASELFKQLALKRNYYGFLSAQQTNQPIQLNHSSVAITADTKQQLLATDEAKRVHELLQLGRRIQARREWRDWTATMAADELIEAAVLANYWGWHSQAIAAFGAGSQDDDLSIRFPMPLRSLVTELCNKFRVSPALVYALIRRESAFRKDAISSAGAVGLMQILPQTAQMMEPGVSRRSKLLEPETNLRIGIKYLRYLLDKFDDNPVLALAAYNAGWKRVEQWVEGNQHHQLDIWIENISFRETRAYVKAVFSYKLIYQSAMGLPHSQLTSRPLRSFSIDSSAAG